MPDETRVCRQCGQKFSWTEKEQRELAIDQAASAIVEEYDPGQECKSCRIKQDGQR
jgi:phage anti-repressor protein